MKGGAYILAVSEDGYVISDSRKTLNIILNNDNSEELVGYFQTLEQSEGAGLNQIVAAIGANKRGAAGFSRDGEEFAVAYAKVSGGWTLLAIEKATGSRS